MQLPAPQTGFVSDCVPASPGLEQEVTDHPERFYVNVHNAPYPSGAVRAPAGLSGGYTNGQG